MKKFLLLATAALLVTGVAIADNGKKKKKKVKTYEAEKGSALEFVRKLRKDSQKNAQSSTVVSKTREQEISQIGLSLTRRISDVARSTRYGKKNFRVLFQKKNL